MKKSEKVNFIIDTLEDLYPNPSIPLFSYSPYTHLISVLLSAQCTDARVNTVTPTLFALGDTPEKMSKISIQEIETIIKPCGLSPRKSKAISILSKILCKNHNNQVPEDLIALESLPGVGHKTAQVVMGQCFGHPTFPVDTHIHRLIYRWGISNGKSVEQTEKDCKRLFPQQRWNKLHLQIIYFGREHCPARGHIVSECPICAHIGRRSIK